MSDPIFAVALKSGTGLKRFQAVFLRSDRGPEAYATFLARLRFDLEALPQGS